MSGLCQYQNCKCFLIRTIEIRKWIMQCNETPEHFLLFDFDVTYICRLFCLFPNSRATEMQAKFIEEETQRRIEDIVMKRVEEELAKRKIDVDEEVMRKVEEAKKHVEHHLEGEYERRTKEIAEQYKAKEVSE